MAYEVVGCNSLAHEVVGAGRMVHEAAGSSIRDSGLLGALGVHAFAVDTPFGRT